MRTKTNNHLQQERGVVSIFIVIFTALLVTIVTTSFVQIMLRNQQQASNNDLSQSAYDSALAGVEDAKRALVKLKECTLNTGLPGCGAVQNLASRGEEDCEILGKGASQAGLVDFVDGEVQVGEPALNQAYSCVKVDVQTGSYVGKLDANQAVVIPLIPVGDPNNLTAVRISWYAEKDLPEGQTSVMLPSLVDLPENDPAAWGPSTPPIMRSQLIQFDGASPISLDAFDGGNARTRLLYPLSGPGTADFNEDTRRGVGTNSLSPGGCRTDFWYNGYACSVTVAIPGGFSAPAQREAYLQLAGYYIRQGGSMSYSVEMIGVNGSSVDFDNVQPAVDSTGRASDLFRRVSARVTISPSGVADPFPNSTITTTNICKDFAITDTLGDFQRTTSAAPLCEP